MGTCPGRRSAGSGLMWTAAGKAEVDSRRGHQAESGMSVTPVVPAIEGAHPERGLPEVGEAAGESRVILDGFEARFRERVVFGAVSPRAARLDPEERPEVIEWLGDH